MLLLSAALLAAALQQLAPPQAAPAPAAPTHIESSALGLSLDLPAGIVSHPEEAARIGADKQKAPTGEPCTSAPLIANDPTALRRISILVFRKDCATVEFTQERLRSIALNGLNGMLRSYGKQSMTSPLDYDLGKHTATVVSGSVYSKKNHGILFAEASCFSAVSGDIVCAYFTASTASKLARLAALPIVLDEKQVVMIPEDMTRQVALPTHTFGSETLHLEYTYPGSFADSKQRNEELYKSAVSKADTDKAKILECSKVLVGAQDIEDDGRATLMISEQSLDCNGIHVGVTERDVKAFGEGIAKGIHKAQPAFNVSKHPPLYSLGGHPAGIIRAEGNSVSGTPLIMETIYVLLDGKAVVWSLSATKEDMLKGLTQSPTSFDGKLPTPLVPAEVLAALK